MKHICQFSIAEEPAINIPNTALENKESADVQGQLNICPHGVAYQRGLWLFWSDMNIQVWQVQLRKSII